jgi:glycerophosphoryl diester phosphodiesterase
VALIVGLLAGTVYATSPPFQVPANCAGDPHSVHRTAADPPVAWNGPGRRIRGHAHNDYEHRDPLTDALAAGFRSVEVDVWAVDGELLVAHDREDVDPDRSLSSLYLEPLARRFAADHGRTPARRLQLLVDVKSAPARTLPLLSAELSRYGPMLTRYTGCNAEPGPVSVVVSGPDVHPSAPATGSVSYYGYDVQPERTPYAMPDEAVTPLVSVEWDTWFDWEGRGRMPVAERDRLEEMVRTAHDAGSAIRFYDTPDDRGAARRSVWRQLVAAGVDYLNTDDLVGFAAFTRGPRATGYPRRTLSTDLPRASSSTSLSR